MKLIWLDLETTGLVPERDQILEVYAMEADLSDPFNAHEIYHAVLTFHRADAEWLARVNPFVFEMHTNNGLLEDTLNSTKTIREVEADLLKLIQVEAERESMPTLAGSTVHFDLAFLRHHMPELAKRFSHRCYDVSAVQLFARSLGMAKLPRAEAHRAKDDVLESIENGRKLAAWAETLYLARKAEKLEAVLRTMGEARRNAGGESSITLFGTPVEEIEINPPAAVENDNAAEASAEVEEDESKICNLCGGYSSTGGICICCEDAGCGFSEG